ncbi:hypothetical protein LCGC14_2871760, partial [marine sediment metagenome]
THDFGFTPVVEDIVGLGSMVADQDVQVHVGESIFYLIREATPELNRVISILQSLTFKGLKPPLQEFRKKDGAETPVSGTREFEDANASGAMSSVDAIGAITPVDFGDATRAAEQANAIMQRAMEEGSISSLGLGRPGSPPPSGILAIVIGEGRDKIFSPRLKSRGRMKRDLAAMIIRQVLQIGGMVKVGTPGHERTFDTRKLKGQWEIFYTYAVNSQSVNAGRVSLAAAHGELLSDDDKRESILMRVDPKGDKRRLWIQRAEQESESIRLREKVKAYVDEGQFENARILTDEAKVKLAQLLEGNIEPASPKKMDEPKQVLALHGGSESGTPDR